MCIEWTPIAEADLDAIVRYIAEESLRMPLHSTCEFKREWKGSLHFLNQESPDDSTVRENLFLRMIVIA
jgi:plasmid stabilization system protein ParE